MKKTSTIRTVNEATGLMSNGQHLFLHVLNKYFLEIMCMSKQRLSDQLVYYNIDLQAQNLSMKMPASSSGLTQFEILDFTRDLA